MSDDNVIHLVGLKPEDIDFIHNALHLYGQKEDDPEDLPLLPGEETYKAQAERIENVFWKALRGNT